MADKMFVSPRTVDNYREALFQKLNLNRVPGLCCTPFKMKYLSFNKTFE